MYQDSEGSDKPTTGKKVWSAAAGISFLLAILIFPLAALVTVAAIWFAPIWNIADKRRLLIAKVLASGVCAAILFPVVSRLIEFHQATNLTCSSTDVTELAAQIIEEKILMTDVNPTLTAIRTVPNTDITTCRSLVQYTLAGTSLEQNIVYTIEWTDEGEQYFVQVRFE